MDLRPILYVIGILLSVLSVSLVLPMALDLYLGHEEWKVFFLCAVLTAFFGGALVLSNAGPQFTLTLRQAFMLTTASWVVTAAFGALPFYMSTLDMGITDSIFEAVSGVTTTGATVISGLNDAPPGILLWRGLLQWLGGIGIIIMALSVLPFLKVGGMQLFRLEASGSDRSIPRTIKLAHAIILIYVGLTFLCATAYNLSGLGGFDAFIHAMTTISSGGFSTADNSLGHFNSVMAEITATVFMIISALPFVLLLRFINGNFRALFNNSQVRVFMIFISMAALVLTLYMVINGKPLMPALLSAAFHSVSLITGTAFFTETYSSWGALPVTLLLFLMALGGCAGSTTCGIKIFRFEVLYAIAQAQIKKLIHPSATSTIKYNGRPMPDDVPTSVMSFFCMFAIAFILGSMAVSMTGVDFTTALSGVLACLSNVGPGLGDVIGPGQTYASLPDISKWILAACMMLGRLELFTVIVLFSPYFWRK